MNSIRLSGRTSGRISGLDIFVCMLVQTIRLFSPIPYHHQTYEDGLVVRPVDSTLFRPFNLDISNWDENSFVTWYHVTNDGRTQLDGRPHGDALVLWAVCILNFNFPSWWTKKTPTKGRFAVHRRVNPHVYISFSSIYAYQISDFHLDNQKRGAFGPMPGPFPGPGKVSPYLLKLLYFILYDHYAY